ncbi:carboxymuconolactone decarboxylase family protein [Jatrophihabitans sp. DSM 45814]
MSQPALTRRELGKQLYAEIMTVPAPADSDPFNDALLEFVFAEIWSRPGLSRRDRRFVTLACVAAADTIQPIEDHVYAALNSGDITIDEMLETVLHFAVYCGWPKGSLFNQIVAEQWARIHSERGLAVPEPTPILPLTTSADPELRLQGGEKAFKDINVLAGAPPRDNPYSGAGILNFVFGEMWQRPGLGLRERRLITVACVALDDTAIPIQSHVYASMASGDVTVEQMKELALQFAAYYGWPKGSYLNSTIDEQHTRIEAERAATS